MKKGNPKGTNQRNGVKNAHKELIKVRFKPLANGNQSIYLDYYNNGKRQYEFLKLYLVPAVTDIDKTTNAQTLQLAHAIKAEKIVELQNTAHGFTFSKNKLNIKVIDYLQKLAVEKKQNYYKALSTHIIRYSGEETTFKQITKEYCQKFIDYLKTAKNNIYKKGQSTIFTTGLLSDNTRHAYLNILNITLNRAVTDGIISKNPFSNIDRNELPKQKLDNRDYLTIDEVKKLVNTPCHKPIIKNAFLFSCFSGLRYSDVITITWGQFQTDNEGKTIIRYKQKKTQKDENLQLSDEALKFLPQRDNAKDADIIFPITHNGFANETLRGWVMAAGITKRVTFHVGRHTNATLLLSLGVPIETVSKLLGHSNIATTQIYAKVIDKNKREAVSKLDGLTD